MGVSACLQGAKVHSNDRAHGDEIRIVCVHEHIFWSLRSFKEKSNGCGVSGCAGSRLCYPTCLSAALSRTCSWASKLTLAKSGPRAGGREKNSPIALEDFFEEPQDNAWYCSDDWSLSLVNRIIRVDVESISMYRTCCRLSLRSS